MQAFPYEAAVILYEVYSKLYDIFTSLKRSSIYIVRVWFMFVFINAVAFSTTLYIGMSKEDGFDLKDTIFACIFCWSFLVSFAACIYTYIMLFGSLTILTVTMNDYRTMTNTDNRSDGPYNILIE